MSNKSYTLQNNRLYRELFANGYSGRAMRKILLIPKNVETEDYFSFPHKYLTIEAAQRAAYILKVDMYDIIKLALNRD